MFWCKLATLASENGARRRCCRRAPLSCGRLCRGRYLPSVGVRGRVLQRVDEALLGGTACLVPLKDAGVVEHVAKHHADLLVQDVDGVIRRKLIGKTGKDVLGPCGVAAAKVVALERGGKVVAGVDLGGQQVFADGRRAREPSAAEELPSP